MLQRTVLIACGLFLFLANVSAQNNSTLRGQTTDQNRAVVAGVTVTVTGDQLQGKKTAVTDENGSFAFLGLAPGTYEIETSRSGFKPLKQSQVLLRASQTIDLDLLLEVGEATASVEVKAGSDTPIVDTSNPEKNYNISGEFITQLPLNSRQSWEALWTMVPGVGAFPDGANYDPVVNGAGSLNSGAPNSQGIINSVSNSYSLNGFNIGNAFTNQGWRTQFSTEAIEDVVVKTAGADASTSLALGGAVNVVTKSGSNNYHGSAGMYFQPKNFNWTNVPGGTSSTLTLYQPDLTFGGPVILPWFGEGTPALWKGKDRLWFFTSYRNVITNSGIARSAAQLAVFTQNGFTPPDFDVEERSHRFTGKVSYQANSKHSFVFNYLNDSGNVINSNANSASLVESTIRLHEGGPTYQIAWTGNLSSNFLWTAQYGKRSVDQSIYPYDNEAPARVLWETTIFSGGNRIGSGQQLVLYGNSNNASTSLTQRPHQEFTTDITWLQNLFGTHTIQSGFQLKPATKQATETIIPSSRITNIEEVMVNGVRTPFRQFSWLPGDFAGSERSTAQYGFYLQDKWRINSMVSINFGARFDNQRSYDVFDIERFSAWTTNPRLGFAISLNKDGRDVIRGSYGRYSDILTLNATPTISGGGLGQPGFQYAYDNSTPQDGILETLVVTAGSGFSLPTGVTGTTATEIDPNITVSYKDEFQLGYTRQLPWKMVFDAGYIQSEFKNPIGNFNRNYVFTNGVLTALNVAAINGTNVNIINTRQNLTNFKQKYRSFQMSLIRNFGSKYSFFANYTYQKRTQTGDFAADDPQLYLHPTGFFDDDKQVRPWLAAINGDAQLPLGFRASAIFTIESGNYGGYLLRPATTAELAATPTNVTVNLPGGGTRSITNPLRSTTRLLNPRSEGRLQLPTRYKLNLRLGKNFTLPWEGQRFETSVDIFNVFNESTALFFANSTRPDQTTTFGTYSSTVGSPRGVQLKLMYRF